MINKIIDLNNKYRIIKCEISKTFTKDYNILHLFHKKNIVH
jgi:hypothetical protein